MSRHDQAFEDAGTSILESIKELRHRYGDLPTRDRTLMIQDLSEAYKTLAEAGARELPVLSEAEVAANDGT